MTISLDAVFCHDPNIVDRNIAGEVILVPIRNNVGDLESIYTLNETAARIWELLDGVRDRSPRCAMRWWRSTRWGRRRPRGICSRWWAVGGGGGGPRGGRVGRGLSFDSALGVWGVLGAAPYEALGQARAIAGSMELTFRCNLHCAHCYLGSYRSGVPGQTELSTAEFRGILDEVVGAGCLWMLFTGGEPLVRSDFRDCGPTPSARDCC